MSCNRPRPHHAGLTSALKQLIASFASDRSIYEIKIQRATGPIDSARLGCQVSWSSARERISQQGVAKRRQSCAVGICVGMSKS